MKASRKLSWLLVVTGPYLPPSASPPMASRRLSLIPASADDIVSELPPEEPQFRTIPSPPTEDTFERSRPVVPPPPPNPPPSFPASPPPSPLTLTPPANKQDKWTPEGMAAATICGAVTAALAFKNREVLGWYFKEQFSRLKGALPQRLQLPKR